MGRGIAGAVDEAGEVAAVSVDEAGLFEVFGAPTPSMILVTARRRRGRGRALCRAPRPTDREGCPVCSFWADNFNAGIVHLNQRDVTMVCVLRAPLAQLAAYKRPMGWSFPWDSSGRNDFNYDFGLSLRDVPAGPFGARVTHKPLLRRPVDDLIAPTGTSTGHSAPPSCPDMISEFRGETDSGRLLERRIGLACTPPPAPWSLLLTATLSTCLTTHGGGRRMWITPLRRPARISAHGTLGRSRGAGETPSRPDLPASPRVRARRVCKKSWPSAVKPGRRREQWVRRRGGGSVGLGEGLAQVLVGIDAEHFVADF
jgi:hypothetical protein